MPSFYFQCTITALHGAALKSHRSRCTAHRACCPLLSGASRGAGQAARALASISRRGEGCSHLCA
eukprot:3137197-Pleurochrysis_carterae.AAC.1